MSMKRREVVVSTLGSDRPSHPGPGHSEDELVAGMATFWERELERVLPDQPDLVVLPELCDQYEGAPRDAALSLRGPIADAMVRSLGTVAEQAGCHLVYGTMLPDDHGTWHNSAALLDRSGALAGRYDKVRLVPTEYELDRHPGRGPVVVDTDFGRIGFTICFDLNFTELLDAYRPLAPDVMVFPSRYHGGLMQPYWAYQLRSHFIGSVGITNLTSDVWSPVGHKIAGSTNYQPWITTTINTNCVVVHLDGNREGPLQDLKRTHGPAVTITDPGELGSVLVTSNDPEVPVSELVAEFGLELLDDYLVRSRTVNCAAIDALPPAGEPAVSSAP